MKLETENELKKERKAIEVRHKRNRTLLMALICFLLIFFVAFLVIAVLYQSIVATILSAISGILAIIAGVLKIRKHIKKGGKK